MGGGGSASTFRIDTLSVLVDHVRYSYDSTMFVSTDGFWREAKRQRPPRD